MPNSCPSEERFPLLLLFLEDGQRSSKHNKRIIIDKSRYQGITSGATAVITQWPGHLATCWLTATLIGLTIILLSMMMFALSMRPGIHLLTARCKSNHIYDKENETATIHLVHGRHVWVQSQLDTLEQIAQNYPQSKIEVIIIQNEINFVDKDKKINQVINFSGPDKDKDRPPTTKAPDVLSAATTKNAELTGAQSSSHSQPHSVKTTTLRNLKRIKRIKRFLKNKNLTSPDKLLFYPWEKYQLSINIGTKNLLKMLLHGKTFDEPFGKPFGKRQTKKQIATQPTTQIPKIKSIEELIKIYPRIHILNSTYERIFRHSPLYFYWQNTNEATRLFAVRVLQMWNFAGITFDLPEYPEYYPDTSKSQTDYTDIYKYSVVNNNSPSSQTNEDFRKFKKLITVGLSSFDSLPRGLVTVDDEGLHMETKTTCHAFFGEVLMGLRGATRKTTAAEVIRQALKAFCKRGAVDADYCQKVAS